MKKKWIWIAVIGLVILAAVILGLRNRSASEETPAPTAAAASEALTPEATAAPEESERPAETPEPAATEPPAATAEPEPEPEEEEDDPGLPVEEGPIIELGEDQAIGGF